MVNDIFKSMTICFVLKKYPNKKFNHKNNKESFIKGECMFMHQNRLFYKPVHQFFKFELKDEINHRIFDHKPFGDEIVFLGI